MLALNTKQKPNNEIQDHDQNHPEPRNGRFSGGHVGVERAVTLTQVGITTNWDINIDPITFTANSNVENVEWLIFEDYFSANATANGSHVSGILSVSVNGGATINLTPFSITGTWGGAPFGALDSNDLFINLYGSGLNPSLGDTVTVSGSLRFSSTVGLAPVAGPVNAALWNSSGAIQTDVVSVAVPELSTPPYWASVDSP